MMERGRPTDIDVAGEAGDAATARTLLFRELHPWIVVVDITSPGMLPEGQSALSWPLPMRRRQGQRQSAAKIQVFTTL